MRLLHSKTYELREFVDNEATKVEYAILSHTWDQEEVIFQDLQSWTVRYTRKLGWKKIEYGCKQAQLDGMDWIWMDTVCIDKSSSAELSEAINSMFKWYRDAKVCYAYLADIPAVRWSSRDHYSCFRDSRWFSRGWTLQELLAPRRMILYGTDWNELGSRDDLSELISQVSGIQGLALKGHEKDISNFSVAQRMCWASRRETTRSEDMAYCLLGLFDVNMPLLYGEGGKKAFIRLQEEIMKDSDDHTLFAWTVPEDVGSQPGGIKEVGLLAEQPLFFRYSKDVLSFRRWDASDIFSMTNKGLRITVPLIGDVKNVGNWIAYLDCHELKNGQQCAIGIPLQQLSPGGDQYARVAQATLYIPLSLECEVSAKKQGLYIRKEIIKPHDAFREGGSDRLQEFKLIQTPPTHELVERYGSSREESHPQGLLAPRKTTSYWIDPLAWANWRAVCLFEAKESVYRVQMSSFILVLGYDRDTAKSWCVIEPYSHQSLRDVWDSVQFGKADTVNEVLLEGRTLVSVDLQPAVDSPGTIEVRVKCNHSRRNTIDSEVTKSLDLLSILSNTDDVADGCQNLVEYLSSVALEDPADRPSVLAVKKSIRELIEALKALAATNKEIQNTVQEVTAISHSSVTLTFWTPIAKYLKNCRKAVDEVTIQLKALFDNSITSLHEVVSHGQSHNLEYNILEGKWLEQTIENVLAYHKILQIPLLMVALYDDGVEEIDKKVSRHQLSKSIKAAQEQLATHSKMGLTYSKDSNHDKITLQITRSTIADFQASVNNAITAIKATGNRHFSVPGSPTAIFTGRGDLLALLKDVFFQAPENNRERQQRRFVLYGLGGSGKSETCIQFAFANRNSYWGVFWIDLHSTAAVKVTCRHIANIGGVEPTVDAAINWLSSIKRQYLLILDNASDVSLSRFLPQGTNGHVIVTARGPAYNIYGNIGCRYLLIKGLRVDDANSLLLKAAGQSLPWDRKVLSHASTITQALDFHPLAIRHAGKSILEGFCTLEGYLAYYERYLETTRSKEVRKYELYEGRYNEIDMIFELAYCHIKEKNTLEARDAIQLLNIFGYFHHHNIRFDILERAIRYPAKVREAHETNEEEAHHKTLEDNSKVFKSFQPFLQMLQEFVSGAHAPPVLPDAIRDEQSSHIFIPDRLRSALGELVQFSLIIRDDSQDSDSYSMHPLVHRWARERPELMDAEEALWSEAAATTLSHSLLLLQLDSAVEDDLYNTAIIPHIQHVVAYRRNVRNRMSKTKVKRTILRPSFILPYKMSMTQVGVNMRLSTALAQGGLFSDASELQETVMEHVLKSLGIEHKITRQIMLMLAKTYANLGELEKSEKLLTRVLEACDRLLDSNDPEIRITRNALTDTLVLRKRYTDAQKQHQVDDRVKNLEGQQDASSHKQQGLIKI